MGKNNKSIRQCNRPGQIIRAVESQGGEYRRGGNGLYVITGKDGQRFDRPIPLHQPHGGSKYDGHYLTRVLRQLGAVGFFTLALTLIIIASLAA